MVDHLMHVLAEGASLLEPDFGNQAPLAAANAHDASMVHVEPPEDEVVDGCRDLLPGEGLPIMEGQLADSHGLELDGAPPELGPQLTVPFECPCTAFAVGCHDCRMMHHLQTSSMLMCQA